jgi:hypothetical protein
MRKLLFGSVLLAIVGVFPGLAMARVDISIGLPPPVAFSAPPEVVPIPDIGVYVVPDAPEDMFFYSGYWWRPWRGHWFRSARYDGGWVLYDRPPSVLRDIPYSWREEYREHRWRGHEWREARIPYERFHGNWRRWEKEGHWRHRGEFEGRREAERHGHMEREHRGEHGRG